MAQDSIQRFVPVVKESSSLPRFNLDFQGGSPADLVKAIEKAEHKQLNVIIPEDSASLRIPGILVNNVTVPQLFEAITLASKEVRRYSTGSYNWSQMTLTYGFRTLGEPNENSIWYFYRDKLPEATPPPAFCRFYQLSPYLDAGYRVEDITTAIETAWKMLGASPLPELKYHKDTKMLIAVGESDKLKMINDALEQLEKGIPKPKSSNGQSSEKPKTQ